MKTMNGKLLSLDLAPEGFSAPRFGTCKMVERAYDKWLERRGFKQRSMRETNNSIFASNARVLRDEDELA